jgi:4-amino-4-deoxy-L-arabinose transferase-like glycosyltransferase
MNANDLILCLLITCLGAITRIYSYDLVPGKTFTFDEYAFAWSGMSLLQNGIPKSWSYLAAYDPASLEPFYFLGKKNLFLTSPWFDHPPLYSLVVGSAALFGGAKTFADCDISVIRIPSLIFGILAIALFYILAKKLFNTPVAVVSSLIFATNPSLVFLSRLAVSENFIVFLSLITLLCFLEYDRTSKSLYLFLAIVAAGLAPLTKITGIFLVISLCLLLAYRQKWKKSILALIIGLLMFSLYFVYGYLYDFKLFLTVLKAHSKRFDSILLFKDIVFQSGMPFFDPWLILGWFSILLAIEKYKNKLQGQIIYLPVLIYLFLLLFSGAQSHYYAWYTIIIYPFLCLSVGIFLTQFLKQPSFFNAGLIVLFIFTWSINYSIGNPWSDFYPLKLPGFKYLFQVSVSLVMLPFFLQILTSKIKIDLPIPIFAKALIAICLLGNLVIIYNLPTLIVSDLTPLTSVH